MSGRSRAEFGWAGPGDFVRLDGVCAELLGEFFDWLRAPEGGALPLERANAAAHAADRYLRDFAVDIAEAGPADADPSLPRRYLANWYVVHTLEPTHAELDAIREALVLLYRYLAHQDIVDGGTADAALAALADAEYFHRRLEEFWELTPEAVGAWRAVDEFRRGRAAPSPG